MKKVRNFARFYALLNKLPADNKEHIKKTLVESFTNGRTTSLREMRPAEYNAMCDSMDRQQVTRIVVSELKAQRSAVLHRLQKLGIDTSDWSEVDKFCLNTRIAGKKFYNLTVEELSLLIPKLEAIARKPQSTKRKPKQVASRPDPEQEQLLSNIQLQYLIMNMNPSTLN